MANDNKDLNTLGRRLRDDRHAHGWSLDELTKISGVTKASIHRLENADVDVPSPQTLQRLAGAMETEVEDYFALAGFFTPHGLPGLKPYLRAKYEVPNDVAQEVEDYLSYLQTKLDQDKESA